MSKEEVHVEQYEVEALTNDPHHSHHDTVVFSICCATPEQHYKSTTTVDASKGTAGPNCNTGLRIYEGGQLLSLFLHHYGDVVKHWILPFTKDTNKEEDEERKKEGREKGGGSVVSTAPPAPALVVEIGCGCGLVGLTAATVFQSPVWEAEDDHDNNKKIKIIFTDASEECLKLVRQSGERNYFPSFSAAVVASSNEEKNTQAKALHIVDGKSIWSQYYDNNDHPPPPNSALETLHKKGFSFPDRSTFPFCWGEEGLPLLQQYMRLSSPHCCRTDDNHNNKNGGGVRLVLGSDLIYYFVELRLLLSTCRQLIQPPPTDGSLCVVLLAHYVRVPNGKLLLYQHATSEFNFYIGKVSLGVFLPLKDRGWSNGELVLLIPRELGGDEEENNNNHDDDNDNDNNEEEEEENVRGIKRLLRKRVAALQQETLSEKETTLIHKIHFLIDHIVPYLDKKGTAKGKEEEEEGDMLFCDLI